MATGIYLNDDEETYTVTFPAADILTTVTFSGAAAANWIATSRQINQHCLDHLIVDLVPQTHRPWPPPQASRHSNSPLSRSDPPPLQPPTRSPSPSSKSHPSNSSSSDLLLQTLFPTPPPQLNPRRTPPMRRSGSSSSPFPASTGSGAASPSFPLWLLPLPPLSDLTRQDQIRPVSPVMTRPCSPSTDPPPPRTTRSRSLPPISSTSDLRLSQLFRPPHLSTSTARSIPSSPVSESGSNPIRSPPTSSSASVAASHSAKASDRIVRPARLSASCTSLRSGSRRRLFASPHPFDPPDGFPYSSDPITPIPDPFP